MADDTIEATVSSHSHEGDEICEGGRINVNPPDHETTQKKCNVVHSGHRDSGSEVPRSNSVKSKKSLALVGKKKDGQLATVPVDVHHPYGECTTDENDEEPDQPGIDSSDGMTLWYLREDADRAGDEHAIVSQTESSPCVVVFVDERHRLLSR